MRICHVIEAAGAGAGQVVVDLARLQCAEGHDVTVIYSPARAEPIFEKEIHAIPGLLTLTSPMQRRVNLLDAWHLLALLRLFFQQKPYEIVHAHSSKAGALVRLIRPFLRHSKVVYTPHAFVTMGSKGNLFFRLVERAFSFLCDAIIATSGMEKDHGIEVLKIANEKIHIVLNGIRKEPLVDGGAARAQLGFPSDVFLIGFVGRLAIQKNLPRLLEVFGLCYAQNPSMRLAILGDGERRGLVERIIQKRGWSDVVHVFHGLRARDYYAAFDLVLNSSDYESFGLILVEALAAGVPVVTTPVGVASQAIDHGKTGWRGTFEPAHLAQGVMELASLNPALRARMAEACLEKAELFSDEVMAAKTMDVYRSVLS